MISPIPPAAIFIIGALLVPFLKGNVRSAYLLLLPVVAFINLLGIPEGTHWVVSFLNYDLIIGRVDKLSVAFAYIFILITFIANLYALRVKENGQHVAALVYAGSALGAVFAGDLLTLFIFWEVLAISATYLIWARRTEASHAAGFRYLLVHIFGGVCLLIGIVMHVHTTGSIEFGYIGLNGLASLIILIGFGINVGFPLLHAWLTDAYPESTVTGTVFLSAFTTKVAVYALARAFPGTEALVWIGAIMAVFPIFYAVIENNIRRIIAYCIINQGGFMVVGIGIGTALSINGAVAHAFACILYAALLLMATGAVIHQTGKSNTTDLGGLYKSMPLTTIFCIIGAASISAVPFFSGFVTKSMTVTAAGYEGMAIVWLALLFASATVLIYVGIRVPYFTFFSNDSGIKTEDPPSNMLIAMGITAFLCIFIGIVPSLFYNILPYPVDFQPYTAPHIMKQLHLLFFSALAFGLFLLFRIHPAEIRAINIDADWFYRKGAVAFMWILNKPMAWVGAKINRAVFEIIPSSAIWLSKDPVTFLKITSETAILPFMGTEKRAEIKQTIKEERERYPRNLRKHWTIGPTVFWTVFIFFLITLIYFWW